jgi:hypothetical protein
MTAAFSLHEAERPRRQVIRPQVVSSLGVKNGKSEAESIKVCILLQTTYWVKLGGVHYLRPELIPILNLGGRTE